MFSTDYLVICGQAFARPMDSASATLESPLDSSKHIIAQPLCPVQHCLMQEFQLSASFVHQSGFSTRTSEHADSILETVSALVGLARRDPRCGVAAGPDGVQLPLTRLGTSNNKRA
jgi:hypothetical protein